jgi:hypothetical protein
MDYFKDYINSELKLHYNNFFEIINKENYLVSGSTALYFYLKQEGIEPEFKPNDLNIFTNSSIEELRTFLEYYDYKNKEIEYHPDEYNQIFFLSDYKSSQYHCNKVYTFMNDENKKIRIISLNYNLREYDYIEYEYKKRMAERVYQHNNYYEFVDNKLLEFILNSFDFSNCISWLDTKNNVFKTYNEYLTKKEIMYLKNLNKVDRYIERMQKYISRGFQRYEYNLINSDIRLYEDIYNLIIRYI